MSTAPSRGFTPQEYLELERKAQTKSEFYRGEIRARDTSNVWRTTIGGNILALIWWQLRGRTAKVYSSDMRIKVGRVLAYLYPDVSSLCHQPQFEDEQVDTLTNPQVLVEVLSPTTENYDRGGKFELYWQIESLREYLVVAQDRVFVEHHARQDDGSWRLVDYRDKDDELLLDSIDCRLRLADVYEKVEFPTK